jgi:hypothetical protein
MENYLIISLILVLAYYFLVHQKKVSEPTTPLTSTKNTQPRLDKRNQSTQTSLDRRTDEEEAELTPILDQLITSVRQLNNQLN